MILVKLIVLITISHICCANYCETCQNHTLCLYAAPGPSSTCKAYEERSKLTMKQINEIVNRINDRRNFVAMGHSKFLPQAANMKKIVWSMELAIAAQRWVDQCHQSIRPDMKDFCRDLSDTKVGQSIATILGSSPGLAVKSFVEMWYIQTLDYKGSVTYYNASQDYKTNHFTQLIWAETEYVGCGKARFYITERDTMAERVVCNFAPTGNVHAKPVYTIGYPSTQCSYNMIPDRKYPGLCCNHNENVRTFTTQRSPVSSLLRILNLSNNSPKQDIDPIGNNFKYHLNSNRTIDQRNQKTRHVFFNNTYGGRRRIHPLQVQHFRNSPKNFSQVYHNHQEKGHSRVYHGYESQRDQHDSVHKESNGEDLRRGDFTTESLNFYTENHLRKHNRHQQCTRKGSVKNGCLSSEIIANSCTRGQKSNSCNQPINGCESTSFQQTPCLNKNYQANTACPCNKQTTTCPPATTQCSCNVNCQCLNIDSFTTRCPNIMRQKEGNIQGETENSADVNYYDMPPNIAARSGGYEPSLLISSLANSSVYNTKNNNQNERQVKDILGYPKLTYQDSDFSHSSFDSSDRERRELGDQITFKPFWQMDEYNHKNPLNLKSIKYTTLGNKRQRKTRTATILTVTEPITIKLKQTNQRDRNTEKYLSFDELIHIRKLSTEDADKDARRKAGDGFPLRSGTPNSTAQVTTTSEYTVNTPFKRKKHCTRKLTCTWTAFTLTGGDGNFIMPGGGALDRGSRTPPGYVDGCTRTSTCTREFMNRNKISPISEETSSAATPEDEDYCERRSLNIQRRNSEEKSVTDLSISYQESFTEKPVTTPKTNYQSVSTPNQVNKIFNDQDSCLCYEEISRKKRDEKHGDKHRYFTRAYRNYRKDRVTKKKLSYGELFYLVLQKIIKSWQYNRISRDCSYSTLKSQICTET